jgi:hypothetical protein
MQLVNPFSLPTDGVRWACFGLSLLVLWRGAKQLDRDTCPNWLKWLAPLTAATLSAGYIVYYLRGGPRIIDATAYYLQGRSFAAGMLTIPLPDPEQAVMGRFLVRASTDPATAAVIFPPGYAAVLAAGFAMGVPLAIGPVIAGLLVVATMSLAREVARVVGCPRPGTVVTYAALASVTCAALRYHTADTMSHGLAALAVTAAMWAWLRLLRSTTAHDCGIVGAALGFSGGLLFATRPASALALAATLSIALLGRWARPAIRASTISGLVVGASGPVALWLFYQHAATGSLLGTAQSAYYGVSDGPIDCFRYGFGEGVGCRGEHGTFVDANLANGYGLLAAAKTTGRRLMMHVSDAMGFAPAFAAVVVGSVVAWRNRTTRVLALLVVAQWLAYTPFYFDGNYPGGGARMFADVLPLQHVLAALGLGAWRLGDRRMSSPAAAAALIGASLFGFAWHLGAHHEQLRDREGGRPMFVAHVAQDKPGILFVDTDHGFNLAYDPTQPHRIARHFGDAIDTAAWQQAGRPRAYRYVFPFENGAAHVLPVDATELAQRRRIEGESLWPATAQRRSWAFPRHVPQPCASGGRVLAVHPRDAHGEVRFRLPTAVAGTQLNIVVIPGSKKLLIKSVIYSHDQPLSATARTFDDAFPCGHLGPLEIPAGAREVEIGFSAEAAFGVDMLNILENR